MAVLDAHVSIDLYVVFGFDVEVVLAFFESTHRREMMEDDHLIHHVVMDVDLHQAAILSGHSRNPLSSLCTRSDPVFSFLDPAA